MAGIAAEFKDKKIEDYRGFFHSQNQWWEVDLEWLMREHPDLDHDDLCIFYRKKDNILEGVQNIFLPTLEMETIVARRDLPLPEGYKLNLNEAIVRNEIKPLPKELFQRRFLFWYTDSCIQSEKSLIHTVLSPSMTVADLDKLISRVRENLNELKSIRDRFK
jgi:hypothetical protein